MKRVRTGTAQPASYKGTEEPEGMADAPIERLLKDIIKMQAPEVIEIELPKKPTGKKIDCKKSSHILSDPTKNLNFQPGDINQPAVIKHRRRV